MQYETPTANAAPRNTRANDAPPPRTHHPTHEAAAMLQAARRILETTRSAFAADARDNLRN